MLVQYLAQYLALSRCLINVSFLNILMRLMRKLSLSKMPSLLVNPGVVLT